MTKRDCVKLLYDSIKSSSSLKYNKDCYIFIAVLPSMPYKSFNAELTKATNLSEWTKLHYAEITDKEVSKPKIFTKIFTPDNKKILLNKLSLIFRKENQFNYKISSTLYTNILSIFLLWSSPMIPLKQQIVFLRFWLIFISILMQICLQKHICVYQKLYLSLSMIFVW